MFNCPGTECLYASGDKSGVQMCQLRFLISTVRVVLQHSFNIKNINRLSAGSISLNIIICNIIRFENNGRQGKQGII